MLGTLAAMGAELNHLQSVWGIGWILARRTVLLLAFTAHQFDDWPFYLLGYLLFFRHK